MVDMYQELIKTHHIISNISFEIRTHSVKFEHHNVPVLDFY